jgi:hypothetical protein
MMPMVEFFQHAVHLAADSFVLANAKDLGDLFGGESRHSQLTGTLEDLVDWKIPPEDEIAAVLDIVIRPVAISVATQTRSTLNQALRNILTPSFSNTISAMAAVISR